MAEAFFGTLYLLIGVCVMLVQISRADYPQIRPSHFLISACFWPGVLLAEFVNVVMGLLTE